MHDEGCTCMVHPRPPCGWCENGGDSCQTCQGDGEVFNDQKHLINCTDCGGTGTDPKYHKPECECGACKEPEPAIIGIDPAAKDSDRTVIFSTPTHFPDWVREYYLETERDRDYRKWRDWVTGPAPTPEPRPIVVVGTRRIADHVRRVNHPRPVVWAPDHWRVMGMSDFDYVEYPDAHGDTGIEPHMRTNILDVIRSRRGVREISIEEAERRQGRKPMDHSADALAYALCRPGMVHVADLSIQSFDTARAMRKMVEEALKAIGIDCDEQPEPTVTVPRICGWKREDATEPATIHDAHDFPVSAPDHRMGWRP